jgi:hypothetical protein
VVFAPMLLRPSPAKVSAQETVVVWQGEKRQEGAKQMKIARR